MLNTEFFKAKSKSIKKGTLSRMPQVSIYRSLYSLFSAELPKSRTIGVEIQSEE